MVKTRQEADSIIATLRGLTDTLDANNETTAVGYEKNGTDLDDQVTQIEDVQLPAIDLNDRNNAPIYQKLAALGAAARSQATRQRMNANRLRSLGHSLEKTNNFEI